ncbi:MAG TPA: hypothetical protein VHC69_06630 [Polyangiaceae bacterium]|nr:hypothetical protein [Polyangiaceae bacterium]
MERSRLDPGGVLALSLLLVARTSRAIDAFEIQVYDGTANRPGVPGLELHVNYVADGTKVAEAPELPMNHVTHLTLEPSVGITDWWELGGYLLTALRGDGRFDYGGVKLRSKFVTPGSFHEHLRLGFNYELSLQPSSYDADRWGGEIRPIVAWEDDRWLFAGNPILDVPLAGKGLESGPTFEPAIEVLRKLGAFGSIGVEYYGAFGPMEGFYPLREQQHYIYQVFNLLAVERLELNIGVGEGLTAASNRVVLKMIAGWSFEPASLKPVETQRNGDRE